MDLGTVRVRTRTLLLDLIEARRLGNFMLPVRRKYPDHERNSGMIVPIKTLNQAATIYEYVKGSGVNTITLNQTLFNCQERPFGVNVLNPATDTTTYQYTWITYANATGIISINANTPTRNTVTALKIRYYDLSDPLTFYDLSIQIRIVLTGNITLSSSAIDTCY